MKLIKYTLTLLAAFSILAACDEIRPEDRYIQLPAVEANRVVLLEEFTGQFCVNCPAAHSVIADLLDQYPDNLIAVSIHAGGDAFSIGEDQFPGIVGLRQPEGELLAASHGINSFPMGVVDRATAPLTSDSWAAAIRAEIQRPTSVELSLTATLNADNQIEITTLVTPYENLDADLHIWVTESDIHAIQLLADGSAQTDYRHNHIFRAAVTPLAGDPVTLTTRQTQTLTHTIPLRPNWTPSNLTLIAFLSTPSTILQSTSTPLH